MAAALTARQRLVAAVWVAALAAVTFVLLPKWQASREGAAAPPSGRVVLRGVITGTPQADMAPTRVVVWAASRGGHGVRPWKDAPPPERARMTWDAPSSGPFELDISPVCADLVGNITVYVGFDHPTCRPIRRHARAWLPVGVPASPREVAIDAHMELAVRLRGRVEVEGPERARVSVYDVHAAVPSRKPEDVGSALQGWEGTLDPSDEVETGVSGEYEVVAPRDALLVVVACAPDRLPSWCAIAPQSSAACEVPLLKPREGARIQGRIEAAGPLRFSSISLQPVFEPEPTARLGRRQLPWLVWTTEGPVLDGLSGNVTSDGAFVVEGVPPGRVQARPTPALAAPWTAFCLTGTPESIEAPASGVTISVPYSRLRLEFVHGEGEPATAWFRVEIEAAGRSCSYGASGRDTEWFVPPDADLRIKSNGGAWTFPDQLGITAAAGDVLHLRIPVRAAPKLSLVTLRIEPPLEHMDAYLIVLADKGDERARDASGEKQLTFVNGVATPFALPPGRYMLSLRPAGGGPLATEEEGWWTSRPLPIELEPDERSELTIPLEVGGRFDVVAPPDQPALLADAVLELMVPGWPMPAWPRMTARGGEEGDGTSGLASRGPYRSFGALPVGSYHVHVTTQSGHKLVRRFDITPRATTRIEIKPLVAEPGDAAPALDAR